VFFLVSYLKKLSTFYGILMKLPKENEPTTRDRLAFMTYHETMRPILSENTVEINGILYIFFIFKVFKDGKISNKKEGSPIKNGFLQQTSNLYQELLKTLNSLKSPEFILNILSFYTIFIIMRYKSIYSLFLMLGVFLTPFMRHHLQIGKVLAICFIPTVFIELISIYLFNIGEKSFEIEFSFRTIFSFEQANITLEFILLMSHFMITIMYLCQALKAKKKKKKLIKENEGGFYLFSILKSIVVKYTDFGSMFILFWIGMYTVNLIHCVLVTFFFVYILMKVSYLPSSHDFETKSKDNKQKWSYYELTLIYWKVLLGYLEFIIMLK